MLCLVVTYSEHKKTVRLSGVSELRIGSGPDNDLVLSFPGVSRHHALLSWRGEGYLLRDLGSKNGLVVEGQRVEQVLLRSGVMVGLGYSILSVEDLDTEEVELGVRFDSSSPSRPSTFSLGLDNDARAGEGPSLAAVLRLVKKIRMHRTSALEGWCHEILEEGRRVLGAMGLFTYRVDSEGSLVFAGVAGKIPLDGSLEREIVGSSGEAIRELGGHEDFGQEQSPMLLCAATPTVAGLCAVFFPNVKGITSWQREIFEHLATLQKDEVVTKERRSVAVEKDVLELPSGMILGSSAPMRELLQSLRAGVKSDLDVLLLGETGTGKELFAQVIHSSGPTSSGPFLPINCAAIPGDLLEAELFGIQARVATNVAARPGVFVLADGGTLFLDEIGEMDERLQAKLLRALQEREVSPVGASKPRKVHLRVIAASNRDLARRVQDGGFRADLYYRLRQLHFLIPPLRERRVDIPELVVEFARRSMKKYGKSLKGVSQGALSSLLAHSWPGNVRELASEVERAVLLCAGGGTLQASHFSLSALPEKERRAELPTPLPEISNVSPTLRDLVDDVERKAIRDALRRTGGNKTEAAALLGITRNGLNSKLKRLELDAGHLDR